MRRMYRSSRMSTDRLSSMAWLLYSLLPNRWDQIQSNIACFLTFSLALYLCMYFHLTAYVILTCTCLLCNRLPFEKDLCWGSKLKPLTFFCFFCLWLSPEAKTARSDCRASRRQAGADRWRDDKRWRESSDGSFNHRHVCWPPRPEPNYDSGWTGMGNTGYGHSQKVTTAKPQIYIKLTWFEDNGGRKPRIKYYLLLRYE